MLKSNWFQHPNDPIAAFVGYRFLSILRILTIGQTKNAHLITYS